MRAWWLQEKAAKEEAVLDRLEALENSTETRLELIGNLRTELARERLANRRLRRRLGI